MRPIMLRLTNFGSFSEAELPLHELSLTAIVGENGAGKSTVLTAMSVALFGRQVAPLDGFIKQGSRSFIDQFTFAVDGDEYRITREYDGRTQKALLVKRAGDEWNPVCEAKATDVDAAVVRILGCSYAEFAMAHHLPQGELGHFAAIDPADRKAWLMGNLPMEGYARLSDAAHEERDGTQAACLRLQAQVDSVSVTGSTVEALTAEIAAGEGTLAQMRTALAVTNAEIEAASERNAKCAQLRAVADSEARMMDQLATVLRDAEAQSGHRRTEVNMLTSELSSLPVPAETDYSELHAERDALAARIDEAQRAESALASCAADHRRAVADVEAAAKAEALALEARDALTASELSTCPTCGQTMGEEARQRAVDVLTSEYVAKHNATEEARAKQHVVDDGMGQAQDALSAFGDMSGAVERLGEIDEVLRGEVESQRAGAKRDALTIRLSEAKERMERATEEVGKRAEALEEQRKVRDQALAEADDCEFVDVSEAKYSASTINAEIGRLLSIIAAKESELDRAKADIEQAGEWREQLSVKTRRLDMLNLLLKAYGKSGIPARIIEHAVDEIETHANEFLGHFTDGLSVQFVTQRENKSGGTLKETLDVLVCDASGARSIERFSGGERTRVNFAMAVGLARFLASHTSGSIESFAVDEPEYLDSHGLTELVECMHTLSASVPSVFLISHYDGVADSLPQRINVKKGADGSKAEVIS